MKIGFSVNIYRLARMGPNFDDYLGFLPKTTFMYYSAHDCAYISGLISFLFIAAIIYFLIFASLAAKRTMHKWIGVLAAFLSIPMAPIVPLALGITLLFKKHDDVGMDNLVHLCGLVEASFEASLQIIWQGYIFCSNQLPTDFQTDIEFTGRHGNSLTIDHQIISYFSISTSILVLGFTSVTSFFYGSKKEFSNHKSDVLLILTSQLFRSLSYILLFSFLPFWYLVPLVLVILTCNIFILHYSNIMQNDPVLLIINGLLNVPMICLFNQNNFSPYSSTSESYLPTSDTQGTEEQGTMNDEQGTRNEELGTKKQGNKEQNNEDVDKKMIKWTNFILIVSIIATAVLVNLDKISYLKENVLTQHGKESFNWVSKQNE